jgi:hypothetical protein
VDIVNTDRLWKAAVCLAVAALTATGQDPASDIRARIQSLQQSLRDEPASGDFAGLNSTAGDLLKSATGALDDGRLYLGLEKLAQASDYLAGARMTAQNPAVIKGGLPAFEAEWNKTSVTLAGFDRELHDRSWDSAPEAIRALAENALVKARPLLDGGRGFATSTKPQDGLFYVGEALGEAQFAQFCAGLRLPRKGRAIPPRSLLPELQALQVKTNAAFEPPRSINLHSRFIALNSTIKLARELDSSRFYSGALYQYLEAVRHYGMLEATAPDAAAQSELKQGLTRLRQQLDAASEDNSTAIIFVERAESMSGSSASADEWKSVRVTVDHVLPAYFAARRSPASVAQAPAKTVEITLVRWPYT